MNRATHFEKVLLLASLLPLQGAVAAEESASNHGAVSHTGAGEAHEHDYHRNVVAAFVGMTSEERREKALTYGVEYERRLSSSIGLGLILEHASGDLDFTIVAVPFAYHNGHWKLYAAPGVEYSNDNYETEFLMRLGVEYAFEIGKGFELSPQVDVDFVDGEVVTVIGLTLGYGF
jgi:outer membrane scaffolding protein for murein synthesis (MipA/OmpV family)